jgi:hypothetical protein
VAADLPALCAKLNDGYDMIIGSRYIGGAKSDDDDFFTGIGNWGFTAMVNVLFGGHFTDVLVGMRAYRLDAIHRMGLVGLDQESWLRRNYLYMNGWEAEACTRAARLKLKTADIPSNEPKRIGGVRKLSILRNGLGTLVQIIHTFLFYHPKRTETAERP